MSNEIALTVFAVAYIEAALSTCTTRKGIPLDEKYGIEDIEPETLKEMVADCDKFQEANREDLDNVDVHGQDDSQAGHDFWLTRNGHGAGFWDGDWETGAGSESLVKRLTDSAESFGEYHLDVYKGKVVKM